ncbi:urate oxidase [Heterostelium album PN500]|uniref:Uricase n=1 Tax=Heterostelium pallidum (strain ATCC 26659 / Pp 5 / PN500) TaxID=670386 RepID=D3BGR1_HETP5|nr:urate oxidase [Heterostelium album PN500]EFA79295.1 urate oxidase [Heterostelium album PN500]|eukprot:XP_020431416.1 urate oxidase [Heterostelium album PN500]
MATLIDNRYGKAKVRVLKVNKNKDYHTVFDLDCCVLLQGQFEETYLTGNNERVVATDSIKNTVYLLAQKENFKSAEDFGIILDLLIMKTTGSGFENFYRDQYTTLPETKDRVFATMVTAEWTFNTTDNVNYPHIYQEFKNSVFDIFSLQYSKSVQETLYLIGKTAIERCKEIDEINLSLPNKHAFGFDFAKLKTKNENNTFQPVEEPSGLIEGTVKRLNAKF